jgi:hypothetical protein
MKKKLFTLLSMGLHYLLTHKLPSFQWAKAWVVPFNNEEGHSISTDASGNGYCKSAFVAGIADFL